jgi:hypothetical protein
VANSSKTGLPGQIVAALRGNEVAVRALSYLHAEMKIFQNLRGRYSLLGIGTSNMICGDCMIVLRSLLGLA